MSTNPVVYLVCFATLAAGVWWVHLLTRWGEETRKREEAEEASPLVYTPSENGNEIVIIKNERR